MEKHPLSYKILNQTRLAHHVDSYFQIYYEIENSEGPWEEEETYDVLAKIRMATYQTILVHLAMIKSRKYVGLYRLINEAENQELVTFEKASYLKGKIDRHESILDNVKAQREKLIAHRSDRITFKEIKDKYPIKDENLRNLIQDYYFVAKELHEKVPHINKCWQLTNGKESKGMAKIIRVLKK